MTVYLAMYKGRKHGRGLGVQWLRFQDWLIRTVTRSPYSHCEIAVKPHPWASVYKCYSASARDGGVRMKVMDLPLCQWDLIPLPAEVEGRVIEQYGRTRGERYDWRGAIGAVFGKRGSDKKWFCSEWCAAAIGLRGIDTPPTPADLAIIVKGM